MKMALLSGSLLIDVGVLLLTSLGAAYFYFTRNYRKWEKEGVPFLKPSPFVGNCKNIMLGKENLGDVIKRGYDTGKGKPVIGIFAFDQPMLVIRDLDLVRSVLVKDFNYFMDRNLSADVTLDSLAGRSLFTITGQKWKHMRMNLTPTFSSAKMKRMFMFVDECGKDLVKYVEKHTADGRLEVKETMARYTTDVIATCAFGIQSKALQQEENEFRRNVSKIFDFTIMKSIIVTLSFAAPAILSVLRLKGIDADTENFVRSTIWDTVEYRKKNGVVRKDFLDLMIQLKEQGSLEEDEPNEQSVSAGKKIELEGDDFVAQAFAFLSAGFETSSTTMSFALFELSQHPDIQTRLIDEIKSVLQKNGGQLTYEGMQAMTYLDMVVSETLRKYPVLPFLDRKVQQPYTIPGSNIQLDKGDVAVISLSGIHYDSEYYPDPQRFDPERFTEENKRTRPNYTYMPFGEGPRGCIGMRMAMMQTKVGLIHFLSHYEVRPCKDTIIPMEFDKRSFLLSAKGTLPLAVKPIKT